MEAAGGAARAERTRGRESSARSTAHELADPHKAWGPRAHPTKRAYRLQEHLVEVILEVQALGLGHGRRYLASRSRGTVLAAAPPRLVNHARLLKLEAAV